MRGVADQRDALFGRDPGGERVAIDQLPIYQEGRRVDDIVDYGIPAFEHSVSVCGGAGGLPAFFNVGFVLTVDYISNCRSPACGK